MLLANPKVQYQAYPNDLKALMNSEQERLNRQAWAAWRGIAATATPVYDLPDAAKRLGLGRLSIKDESVRSS